MRILMLHPEDDPLDGPWAAQPWDAGFDLGIAGVESHRRWSQSLGCSVQATGKIGEGDFDQIRTALSSRPGLFVDQYGLDWWDLISLEFHQRLEEAARLQRVVAKLAPEDEVFITRSGFHAQILSSFLKRPVHCLSQANGIAQRLRHYARVIPRFSLAEMLQILGDKYDTGYRLRGMIAPRRKPSSRPVVLLPSAYVNVSKAEIQYAETIPDVDFLLVATRQSGWVSNPLANVAVAKLASYACRDSDGSEFKFLLERWNQLKRDLMRNPMLSVLIRSGAMDLFPDSLRDGLQIRDAWLQVFEREPVRAVLCADDANFATRIPLLIAARRGLPAVACHHGAIDGRHRFRPKRDCVFLAKGRMEQDYMVRVCGVPSESVEIGAPRRPQQFLPCTRDRKRSIIFFSEPYEVLGGRSCEFYAELLPALAELAASTRCELVVKLHPFESRRERERLVNGTLSAEQRTTVRIVTGPLRDELLEQALCAVTILSTTAVDCTLCGIPVFLCAWLDYSNYGYLQQFAKFSAGTPLFSADEIRNIPTKLKLLPAKTGDLWEPIAPDRLRALLSGRATMAMAV